VERARDLIQRSGYKGEEIACDVLQSDVPLMETVVAMWKPIGVNAKIVVVENAVRAQKMRDKTFQLLVGYPGSPLGDPDGIIWRILGPGAIWDGWREAEFDRLGEEAHYSLDSEQRRRNYERMQDLMLEYNPWIPLYQPLYSFAMLKSIHWRPTALTGAASLRRDGLSFGS
jgi:ABC-type transport system substrate-binding protein